RAPVPVICVGNLVAGGSGKTPVVLSLAAVMARGGIAAHIVSRGYGGSLSGPLRVDAATHVASQVGDEALVAASQTPSWVARDRAAGVRAAVSAGAEAVLLDDGFQNPHVAKDLALLVVDGGYGFGNRRLIPSGPLREPIAAGLARADAVVVVGEGGTGGEFDNLGRPVLHAAVVPLQGERMAGATVIAFAGIGRPEKFFATLRGCGARLAAQHAFPDHHRYQAAELARLHDEARRHGARLVTTEKDWVRLGRGERTGIEALAVALRWSDEPAMESLLATTLQRAGYGNRRIRA
ncbi:MAG: tetraacyldisaccharide 4'-kinase, partial [Alphaproteobacteria bacterium]|nr:tetraacyldisaccharide 4'-kinase [Alphaproteobacteria bacterium]